MILRYVHTKSYAHFRNFVFRQTQQKYGLQSSIFYAHMDLNFQPPKKIKATNLWLAIEG